MEQSINGNLLEENVRIWQKLAELEAIAATEKRTEETLKDTQQELEIRNMILETVNSVTNKIGPCLDYNTIAKEAIAAMIHYGKTSAVSMYEYREESQCLVLIDNSEIFTDHESIRLTQKLYLGKSAAGEAIHKKDIIYSDDLATDQRILPKVRKALTAEGLLSAIFVPLLFHDRALGTMHLLFTEKHNLKDYELETLLSIGKTIGLAMANAKHIEQIKTEMENRLIAKEDLHKVEKSLSESQQNVKISNESLRIINAVADKIYLALDYDTLVKEAMEAMKLYGKTSAVMMFEYNEAANSISLLSSSSDEEYKAETVRLTSKLLPESLTAYTIREKRIIVCNDPANDERLHPEVKINMSQHGLKSLISIPLLFRDRVLGVINLFFKEVYAFTDYELETLLSIGKTIGLAMANARNIEQIKTEIEVRKIVEEKLRIKEKELEDRAVNLSENLSETNTALKVFLRHKDDGRLSLESNVVNNMRTFVFPFLDKLRKSKLFPVQFAMVNMIEKNLSDIVSSFSQSIKSRHSNLTNKEIEIAYLIKKGKTTKEIAELLNIAKSSVDTHRLNLRKKLGLSNKKEVNLHSYFENFS
jgi:GAF domain-containing protein/DNA-binding CsgD family transcriptional regulator